MEAQEPIFFFFKANTISCYLLQTALSFCVPLKRKLRQLNYDTELSYYVEIYFIHIKKAYPTYSGKKFYHMPGSRTREKEVTPN